MSDSSNLDLCLEKLKKCELLSEATVKELCTMAIDILLDESNVREVHAPVTVVGDVHGYVFSQQGLQRDDVGRHPENRGQQPAGEEGPGGDAVDR